MRNISCALTIEQVTSGFDTGVIIKDVTRRLGWANARPGEELMACGKCMGRKPDEPLIRIGVIRVLTNHPEQLGTLMLEPYGTTEARREGFDERSLPVISAPSAHVGYRLPGYLSSVPFTGNPRLGARFIWFFMQHMKATPETEVNRISFEYLREHPESVRLRRERMGKRSPLSMPSKVKIL